jgi:hypothetical protein
MPNEEGLMPNEEGLMPNEEGLRLIQRFQKSHPELKVVAMSAAFGRTFSPTPSSWAGAGYRPPSNWEAVRIRVATRVSRGHPMSISLQRRFLEPAKTTSRRLRPGLRR